MNNPEAFKEDEVRSIKFVVPGLPFGKQRPKVTVRKFTGSDGKEKKFAKAYTPEKTVNYVAGVFGISKMASDSVFVWYVMKVPHKVYRLGRLCYMLAQNREFVDTLLDNIEQEKVTKMRTAMLTRYPENKEVRGIMKLVNRVEDKKNGYKLTYEAELVEGRSEQQTLQEWLRRENEWQKNRAKASSKSKGAK